MRKITLLLSLFITISLTAQETITFESSEGYILGDINGQNGWTTTGTGPGTFVENQVISDEQSSVGDWSFKITTEAAFPGQEAPVVGGFYDYDAPIDYTDIVISYDIYIEQVTDGNDYRFAVTGEGVNEQGEPALFLVYLVDFDFQNNIRVVGNEGTFENVGSWVTNTWYNVRIEVTDTVAEYFIDDTSVGSFNILNELDISGARFVHDNFGGNAFIDNFKTNDESLSNSQFVADNNFVHFVSNNMLNLQSSTQFHAIEVFDMSGRSVIQSKLDGQQNAQIDINMLNQGVYVGRIQTENGIHSFKFAR